MEFNSFTSYFVILFEIYLDPSGGSFVFPYIICGFYIILLLLRTYTASPTALSDASTNTCISEHSSGVHQDTFMRSYWLNAFSSSSSVPFLQVYTREWLPYVRIRRKRQFGNKPLASMGTSLINECDNVIPTPQGVTRAADAETNSSLFVSNENDSTVQEEISDLIDLTEYNGIHSNEKRLKEDSKPNAKYASSIDVNDENICYRCKRRSVGIIMSNHTPM
ncbi:hypothetical protein DINM_006105 [Dirofilaria immitis]|nr:hypothetical protein [Dirofilaria immitis]